MAKLTGAGPGPAEYLLAFAPADFTWRGERAGGLPIPCEKDGSVCEPLLRYFGQSFRLRRVKVSSLRDEAYILREWWAYLGSVGRRWSDVDDQVMIDWRERLKREAEQLREERSEHARGKAARSGGKSRIARKLEVVFSFYDHAARYGITDPERAASRDFVSPTGPITLRDIPFGVFRMRERGRQGVRREWACAEGRNRSTAKRPTPDGTAVQAVLTNLRSSRLPAKGEDGPVSPRRGRPSDEAFGERDWLIGRAMAECGLRRDEIARMTVDAIAAGLAKSSITVPKPDALADAGPAASGLRLDGLDAVAHSDEGRRAIVDQLERLLRQHRRHIYVLVTGKGDKTRSVPFPIEYVRDLLLIGIWTVRKSQIRHWARSYPRARPPREAFLSAKSGRGMTAGAIGDLAKQAFKAAGIEGSGHRLRAHFATALCARLWDEAFARNGFRWDQTVENFVMDTAAQILGHREVATTIRHYLDLALLEYFGIGTKSKLKDLRAAWAAIIANHKTLESADIDLLGQIASRLSSASPEFKEVLAALLSHPKYLSPEPDRERDKDAATRPTQGRPLLRIVP